MKPALEPGSDSSLTHLHKRDCFFQLESVEDVKSYATSKCNLVESRDPRESAVPTIAGDEVDWRARVVPFLKPMPAETLFCLCNSTSRSGSVEATREPTSAQAFLTAPTHIDSDPKSRKDSENATYYRRFSQNGDQPNSPASVTTIGSAGNDDIMGEYKASEGETAEEVDKCHVQNVKPKEHISIWQELCKALGLGPRESLADIKGSATKSIKEDESREE
ncbi:hypothetical protein B0T10DRAFT_463231 [Thelonectria olida]|uniref:Uncharacterized protein n=1 Tax=Thelonectria olida TaxID=1576542 RepID=A0A9P9ANZ3_9HYPO|nr:hypothetical protein B0T10DRAFT_463231 [Thelonectria olida]